MKTIHADAFPDQPANNDIYVILIQLGFLLTLFVIKKLFDSELANWAWALTIGLLVIIFYMYKMKGFGLVDTHAGAILGILLPTW